MALKYIPKVIRDQKDEEEKKRSTTAGTKPAVGVSASNDVLGGAKSFAEYSALRRKQEEEDGMRSAADKLAGQYGYKKVGNKAVFVTPTSPLPAPTKENTATKAKAPGAYGITPKDYAADMSAIGNYVNYRYDNEMQEFLDKYFKGQLPSEEEFETMFKHYARGGVKTEPDVMNFHRGAELVRKATEEKQGLKSAYDDAVGRLGEDAIKYISPNESDYYERFGNTYGAADVLNSRTETYNPKTQAFLDQYFDGKMPTEEEYRAKLAEYAAGGVENEADVMNLNAGAYLLSEGKKVKGPGSSDAMTLEEAEKYNLTQFANLGNDSFDLRRWSQTTPEERAAYQLMERYGYAGEYLKSLEPELNKRIADVKTAEAAQFAKENPFWASARTVATAPVAGLGMLEIAANKLMGKEADLYDPRLTLSRENEAIRTQVGSGMNGVGKFFYNTGMSIADNIANMLVWGGLGSFATLLSMGGSSAASAFTSAVDRGASEKQAMTAALVSGVAETLFEKFSLDNVIEMSKGNKLGSHVMNVLKQMGIEGSEEFATGIANEIADRAIMGDLSNYELLVDYYVKQGMMEDLARRKAEWSSAGEIGLGTLGGIVSGGVMGTGGEIIGSIRNRNVQAELDAAAKALVESETKKNETPATVPEAANTMTPEEQQLEKLEKEYAESGGQEPEQPAVKAAEPTAEEVRAQERNEREDGRQYKQDEEQQGEQPADEAEQAQEEKPAETPENAEKAQMFENAKSAKVTDDDGNEHNVRVVGVESVTDGEVVMKLEDENGEPDYSLASEVQFDGPEGELLGSKGVERMDAKGVRNYLQNYDESKATPQQYATAYNEVYQRGNAGLSYEDAAVKNQNARTYMTENARLAAYAAGLNAYNQTHERVQPAAIGTAQGATSGTVKMSAKDSAQKGKVSRRYSQAAFSNLGRRGRKKAVAQMELLSAIASRTGRTIVMVDHLTDEQGNKANALYDMKTGEIRVALDATEGAYAYAAMHELTHAVKNEHAQEWDGFVKFVRSGLERNNQKWDELVKYQMDRFGYDRETAEEEVICNTVPALLQDESNVLRLYKNNRKLFERVVDLVKGLLEDIKTAGKKLSARSKSWEQMDALAGDRELLQGMYDMLMKVMEKSAEMTAMEMVESGTRPSVMEAPVNENGKTIKYSLTTYNESLPKPISTNRAKALGMEYEVQRLGAAKKRTVVATGRDVTEALMRKEGHSEKVIAKALGYTDKISKWFEKAVGKYEFVNLEDVNNASIMIDHNTGEIKFSCQVPNSEYKVNFDFTTVCRQREAVQRFVDDLAREAGKNGTKLEDISLTPQNIFRLNTILKNEGYETACLGCFVEAKRYRIKAQADTLVEEWNALVRKQNPNAGYFGFTTGETDLMKMSDEEVHKLEASMRSYSTKGTSKAIDRAERLVALPEMQKLIRTSDIISRQGRQKIREFSPALESFLASRFGQSGAKPAVGFMPYNSEIAALPDTKNVKGKRMTLQKHLEMMGGARSNSFSDYIPTHALDYLQRTMDMAARRLTAQCYTKVIARARTFGRTGEKINMSVMFDIDPDMHWSQAGLDKNGEYIVGDKARADRVEKETGVRPFTQSIPYEEAVELEHDPDYADNVGIIGVGYSFNHITRMMDDGNIPYIIPYHRSNMPDAVAKASNTKLATNYEPVQNNTKVTGYAVVQNLDEANGVPSYATWPEGRKKTKASDLQYDLKDAVKRHNGDTMAAINEWLEWMKENNLTPVTSTAEAGHGGFDVYGSLAKTKNTAKTANEYATYCIENGMLPVFYEFADQQGYDKTLFDFSVRNLVTGEVSLQKPMTFDFVENMPAKDMISMMENDMDEYNSYNKEQFYSEKWERVKEQGYRELQDDQVRYSLSDVDDNVREAVDAQQKAFELVKGHRITAAEADKLAGKILQKANSDYDRQQLAAEISRIYDFVERGEDVDMRQIEDEMTDLMARVMSKAKALDMEHEEMAKPIREYLRTTPIAMTDAQMKEAESIAGSYGAFRKSMFGRVRLSNLGRTKLDTAWQELSEMNPELFPPDAKEGDMPELLQRAVDALKPVYHTGMGMSEEESAEWLMGQMNEAYFALPAVKASARNAKEFAGNVEAMAKAMKRFEETSWSEYQNALRGIEQARGEQAKTQKQKETAAMRKKYESWRDRDTAQRKEREMKAKYRVKIERTTNTLMNWMQKPTDAKHVPAGVQDSLRRMLQAFDFSGRTTKTAEDLSARINELATALEKAQEGEDKERTEQTIFLERDQQMIDELRRMAEIIRGNAEHNQREGRGVYELNGLELKELSKWLDVVKHVITEASKLRGSNLPGESVEQVAAMSMQEMSSKKALKDKKWITKQWNEAFGPDMQDSFTFFEKLGPTANAIFMELRKGFDKVTELTRKAEEYTKTILDGVDLTKLTGKKAEEFTFKLEKGGTLKMTKANIMELYVLSKREQAQSHIYGGGVRISGDNDARPRVLTKADVDAIVKTLTADEKRIADGMQQFLSKDCAGWGNETSVRLLGYKKFGEEYYWPIKTDSNSRNTTKLEDNFAANISAIKNQGMTKQTVEGASNPIMIGDIFDTYTKHISNMAAYSAYALPLSDFTRWYNSRGVKTEIEQMLGKKGLDYINNFLMAVNGSGLQASATGLEKVSKFLTRNAKIASVGWNVRVVVQQPTSYARAAMYMSPKYLSLALGKRTRDIELINKYCGIAQWKDWGFYETNIGPNLRQMIVGDESAANKWRGASTWMAGEGDKWTLKHLWNACELETQELYPELKVGTDEYFRQVGERMSEIVDRTQVVDSVFHRSQLMRSKSGTAQMLTNFMAEPTKTYNMLMGAISDYAENRKNKAARNRVARAFAVYAATGVLTAAAAAVVDAFRDDDDEKDWVEKYMSAVGANTVDNLNPAGLLPGVSDVLSLLEGYEPSRLDTQSLQRIVWAAQEVKKYADGESKQNLYGVTYKIAQAASSTLGIPLGNLIRDFNAIVNTATGTDITKTVEAQKNSQVTRLYNALTDGNKAEAKKIREQLQIKAGLTPKEIDTKIAERLLEDERIADAWKAKSERDYAGMNRIKNQLTGMGISGEAVDKAIVRYGEKQEPKEEKPKDPGEQLSVTLYSEKEVVSAMRVLAGIEKGNVTEADVRAMISERVAASEAKDPEKSVKSGIQSEMKKEYLEMEAKGNINGMKRIGMVIKNVLGTDEDTMTGWVRDAHADQLREAVDGYNSGKAATAVAKMRADGKTDSQIKSSLSKYKQLYIDAIKRNDKVTANKIKRMLQSLGLKGTKGQDLYSDSVFEDWLKEK